MMVTETTKRDGLIRKKKNQAKNPYNKLAQPDPLPLVTNKNLLASMEPLMTMVDSKHLTLPMEELEAIMLVQANIPHPRLDQFWEAMVLLTLLLTS